MHVTVGDPTTSDSELIAHLRTRNVVPTQQRVDIARVLLSKPQHMSADQVLAAVNRDSDLVSKATVYNTLKVFADAGLVREVIADPTKIFYDSTTTPHYHMFNADTGELTDIATDTVSVTGLPALPAGTVATGLDVVLRVRNA